MSPLYIARSKQVAARMLGGEMMIMSARRFDAVQLERDCVGDLAGGRRIDTPRRRSSSGWCAPSLTWRRKKPCGRRGFRPGTGRPRHPAGFRSTDVQESK